jgi:hypothetical protein
MSRRAVAVVLCCLGVVLFLSRYAFAIWYRGPNPSRLGVDDFGQLLASVGLMPWVLAVIFFLVGFFYLAIDERDRPKS